MDNVPLWWWLEMMLHGILMFTLRLCINMFKHVPCKPTRHSAALLLKNQMLHCSNHFTFTIFLHFFLQYDYRNVETNTLCGKMEPRYHTTCFIITKSWRILAFCHYRDFQNRSSNLMDMWDLGSHGNDFEDYWLLESTRLHGMTSKETVMLTDMYFIFSLSGLMFQLFMTVIIWFDMY
jgi:hypothetical protein